MSQGYFCHFLIVLSSELTNTDQAILLFDSDLFPVIYSLVRKERGAWGKKWLKERQENAENSSKSAPGSPAAAYPAFKNSFRPRLACIVHLCEQDHFDHTNQPSRAVLGHKVHLLTDMLTKECSTIS